MLHGVEDGTSWSLLPTAGRSGAGIGRDDPGSGEGAEMIDPQQVDLLERGSDSFGPPGIPGFGAPLPIIDRISPELPLGGEGIGRNAGDDGRTAIWVEPEQVPVRPDVGAVISDEDRYITDHGDAPLVRIATHLTPLTTKQELGEFVKSNLVSVTFLGGSEGLRLPQGDAGRPIAPGAFSMRALQGHEGRIIVQPPCLLVPKGVECGPIFRRGAAAKTIECRPQQRPLVGAYLVILNI